MASREVERSRDRIEALIDRVKLWTEDPEVLSHWARYLCIRVSGLIEVSVQAFFSEYATRTSHPRVARHVERRLRRLQNPNMETISQLAGSFDLDWKRELDMFSEGERKDAIDSIVSNRNSIAHGRDVGITIARVKDLYRRSNEVLDFIERLTS